MRPRRNDDDIDLDAAADDSLVSGGKVRPWCSSQLVCCVAMGFATMALVLLVAAIQFVVTVDVVDRATLLRPTGASTTSTRVGHDRMCQDKQSPRVYTRPGLKRDH